LDFSPYEVVVQEDAYRIYWQDEARSVCVLQPLISHWKWDQALKAVETLDAVVRSVPHGVYIVYLFEIGQEHDAARRWDDRQPAAADALLRSQCADDLIRST
jgi:hypothetical protein